MSNWTWKTNDSSANEELRLRYEPGNWGDILKGCWALSILSKPHATPPTASDAKPPTSEATFRYLDPFAGAPTYPLTPTTENRLRDLPALVWSRTQATFAARGRVASTASLIAAALTAEGRAYEFDVFDAQDEHRASWKQVPRTRVVAACCGEDVVSEAVDGLPYSLVLVDPYDLLERWSRLAAAVVELASSSGVLLYLYNKSPRGGGHARAYAAYCRRRDTLLQQRDSLAYVCGRVPADGTLPRAYHEVVFLASRQEVDHVRPRLEAVTVQLATHLMHQGAFEGGP